MGHCGGGQMELFQLEPTVRAPGEPQLPGISVATVPAVDRRVTARAVA